jgi:hypothetical protein
VGVGLVESEWPLGEGDVVAVEEVCGFVRGYVGGRGQFGVAGDVDAVECDLSVGRVAERGPVDAEAVGWHLASPVPLRGLLMLFVISHFREYGPGVLGRYVRWE